MEKFGIYIHWPFCLSKCPYCDFFSMPVNKWDESLLEAAYIRDLKRLPVQTVTSVFFGGGTPSLMSARLINRLITVIRDTFPVAPDVEISLEANPDAIDKPKMEALRAVGVNRLSMGIQALNAADLKFLGRRHSLETAYRRIEEMKTLFSNFSFDLIYARPGQTLQAWQKELKEALSFHPPHLSLYQLTIEEETPFFRRGMETLDDETARTLYEWTLDAMAAAGCPFYEVSNFAKPGFTCRHNLLYWEGDDYAGIGPAAHGRLGLVATENPRDLATWLKGETITTLLSPKERQEEKIMMGLRLKTGISDQGLSLSAIQKAVEKGWLTHEGGRIFPTREGLIMLNQLILELV